MATITGSVAAHATLTTSTVQTFKLNNARDTVTVTVRGTASDIFFTVGTSGNTPTAPTVGGTDCYVAPGVVGGSKTIAAGSAPVMVSVISSGTPGASVEGGVMSLVREP
jgi:hypothetical protein